MACSGCKKIEKFTGLEYVFNGDWSFVVGARTFSINERLIRPPTIPSGGWGVKVAVHGQTMTVPGRSQKEVFDAARRLYETNGIEVRPADLWFNLQVRWLSKTPRKYHKVRLEDLLKHGAPAEQPPAQPHAKPKRETISWSRDAARFLEVMLLCDVYDRHALQSVLEFCVVLSDPVKSPTTGNASLYIKLNAEVNSFIKNPPFIKEDAVPRIDLLLRILGLKERM